LKSTEDVKVTILLHTTIPHLYRVAEVKNENLGYIYSSRARLEQVIF